MVHSYVTTVGVEAARARGDYETCYTTGVLSIHEESSLSLCHLSSSTKAGLFLLECLSYHGKLAAFV